MIRETQKLLYVSLHFLQALFSRRDRLIYLVLKLFIHGEHVDVRDNTE